MKNLITLLILCIGLSVNAQISANGTDNSGISSTALGEKSTASGNQSTALGNYTTASGTTSTAVGDYTTASGISSTAMGDGTTASGRRSTAMGRGTTASDYASTVIGQYNSSGSTVTSATLFSTSAPAFVIGSGTSSSNLSDAFKVMFNGDATVSNDLTIEGSLILGGESYTSFSGGGALSTVSEGGNTGVRLSSSDAANHGDIGSNAVDLSYSGGSSTTKGATGDFSTAMGDSTKASGFNSTAMGYGSTASGGFSTAMGYESEASGDYSIATGLSTTASERFSTAMGLGTTASGFASTAMGRYTVSSDYASTVIGHYNSSGSTATSAFPFSTSAPAFVIGNGTDDSSRSDAFKVMFNGDTYVSNSLYLGGTEITSTAAELNLLSGATSLGTGILEPVTEGSNTGVRLSSSDAANHGDIGDKAVDLSYSDVSSTTFGATGQYSVAMGLKAIANGNVSTAMGADTRANGYVSTALGINTTASGGFSTAIGAGTTASGNVSTAMGEGTKASDYASTVIGQFNSSGSTATSADSFSTSAPAFVIGNGTDDSNLSDAFKVMFNGDATVSNDLTVNGDVTVSSDARLKANIVSLGATLSKLLNIDGKTYTVKKNGAQKIGVLAQDIQEVFPELVSEDNEGMLSVNYQGLIPVLINALKEQQKEIEYLREQEKRIERLEQLIQNL